ncbi:MerR family transcriptional regulator [Sinosporangium siamense]|uniref:MerR family transcriptional regulator n=1 Tax=Sinosporangium siamense TaxID=1367973 RepID=A0A919RES9_9ACTN|nr:MerR family transcriptional regulator [Sinosporangium siamense]GII90459.1 MerR family transcriptional regulator [Sinosporangium siamense]
MSIGEISDRFGLATHVLRHWESMGLLTPARVEGDRCRYGADDVVRVVIILQAKEAGLSLDEIREMLHTSNAKVQRGILLHRRNETAKRIAEAQAALELIDCALGCDHEDFASCADFQEMVWDRIPAPLRLSPATAGK